jgi:uncharacterized protein (TIGR03085 family)
VVRERRPDAAAGIVMSILARHAERVQALEKERPWTELVERVREGPPIWNPMHVEVIDNIANSLEFFVHHEDVRRAQPSWGPRVLGDEAERTLWSMIRTAGKGLTRKAPVGVRIEDATTGATRVLRKGSPEVTVSGPPSEVALYVFGRTSHARVELRGDEAAVARLSATSLGI